MKALIPLLFLLSTALVGQSLEPDSLRASNGNPVVENGGFKSDVLEFRWTDTGFWFIKTDTVYDMSVNRSRAKNSFVRRTESGNELVSPEVSVDSVDFIFYMDGQFQKPVIGYRFIRPGKRNK